jgi:hypothetical protein
VVSCLGIESFYIPIAISHHEYGFIGVILIGFEPILNESSFCLTSYLNGLAWNTLYANKGIKVFRFKKSVRFLILVLFELGFIHKETCQLCWIKASSFKEAVYKSQGCIKNFLVLLLFEGRAILERWGSPHGFEQDSSSGRLS